MLNQQEINKIYKFGFPIDENMLNSTVKNSNWK